uniref:DNA (cytosine-5-)-methyltransferase n=1 Tax=Mycobacterium phage Farewell TaxID=3158893 RepID=A0AAU8GLC2_9CAUD
MLTLTDLFCGAGGSSTGAIEIPGVEVRVASNHWDLAVETHNTNHPDADHVCADLSQIDPRRFPRTDILWASPECTNHSVAKGRKRVDSQPDLFGEVLPDAAAERSRATMWDVPRFAEAHRYQAVIVENVVDAWHWQPFQAWLMAMDSLGYEHHIVFLNSMHAQAFGPGAPQSRDRMYVVFWRRGNQRPDVARIRAGIERYWVPFITEHRHEYRVRGVDVPLQTVAASGNHFGLAVPVEGRDGKQAVPVDQPARTMTTRNETGLAFIAELRGGGSKHRPVDQPLATVTASGTHHGLVTTYYGNGGVVPTREALPTCTTVERHALLMRHHTARGDQGQMSTPVTEPARTMMANGPTPALLHGRPTVDVEDVLFRMLEPREIARAMDFPSDYTILGNRREQVRQAGNAVTPPAARDLVGVVAESLGVAS